MWRMVDPMSTTSASNVVEGIMVESTAVVCGECGKGNYVETYDALGQYFVCTVCATEVTWADILPNLDSEQDAYVFQGVMRVTVSEGW